MTPNFLSTPQPSTATHGSQGESYLSGPNQNSSAQGDAATPFKKILDGLKASLTDRDQIPLESDNDELAEPDLASMVTPSLITNDSASLDTFTHDLIAPRVSMPATQVFTSAASDNAPNPSGLSVEIVSAGHSTELTSVLEVATPENQSRFSKSSAIPQKHLHSKPNPSSIQNTDLGLSNFSTTPNTESLSVTADVSTTILDRAPSATPTVSTLPSFEPATTQPRVQRTHQSPNHSIPEASTYNPDSNLPFSDTSYSSNANLDSKRLAMPAAIGNRGILPNDDVIALGKTPENFQSSNREAMDRTHLPPNSLNNSRLSGFSDQGSNPSTPVINTPLDEGGVTKPSPINTYQPIATGPDRKLTATNPVNLIPTVLNTIRNQSKQNPSNFELPSNATNETNTEVQLLNRDQAIESVSNFEMNDQSTPSIRAEINANTVLSNDGFDNSAAASAPTEPPTISEFNNPFTQAPTRNINSPNSTAANSGLAGLNPEMVATPIVSAIQNQLSEIRDGRIEAVDGGVRIQLDPKELGTVTVEVQTSENVTKIQIVTDQPVAHAMLEKNIESLLQSLDQSDGKSFDVDVSQRDAGNASQENEQSRTPDRKPSNLSQNSKEKNNQPPPESPNNGGVNMVV